MLYRLNDLQPLHTLKRVIQADDYNRVRLALRRIGNPLRFELQNLRCLDIILNDQHWVCVDPCMRDRPVMAWTDFQAARRSAIHTPVECMLRMYHVHAGLVMGEVLDGVGRTLHRELEAVQT
jgi:hypothetical protein